MNSATTAHYLLAKGNATRSNAQLIASSRGGRRGRSAPRIARVAPALAPAASSCNQRTAGWRATPPRSLSPATRDLATVTAGLESGPSGRLARLLVQVGSRRGG